MWDILGGLLNTAGFMPRWQCGLWSPVHGWVHIVSDVAIWAAYFTIPVVLVSFAARRRDLPFRGVFLLFGAFILFCGLSHLIDAAMFWWPAYPLGGAVKLATAIVSWATVAALVPTVPRALALRSPEELEREIAERARVEAELRELQGRLEARVAERTAQLEAANQALQREIQERQRTENSLALALDAGAMGAWEWDLRTNAVTWSGPLEAVHGFEPGSFDGRLETVVEAIHPDDRPGLQEAFERALARAADVEHEFRIRRRDGTTCWLMVKGGVLCDDEGRPARMLGIGMDITMRRQTEQRSRFLAEASGVLAAVVDPDSALQKLAATAVPFFADWCTADLVDARGRLRRVAGTHGESGKAQLLFDWHREYPPDPAAPRGTYAVWQSARTAYAADLRAGERPSATDAREARILDALEPRSFIAVPLKVREEVIGVLSFVMSESGRRYTPADVQLAEDLAARAGTAIENSRLYQELRDADRRKDEFLATLAHELRHPLSPMVTALSLLAAPERTDAVLERATAVLDRQLHHLVRLVDDLLDLARIRHGKLALRLESTDVASVVGRAAEVARSAIEARQHRLRLELPAAAIPLRVDPVRIAQALVNLLTNAAKYMDESGTITVSAGVEDGDAVVRVRDCGVGLTTEEASRIFELFAQAHPRVGAGGLGIGLTLVRSLVQLHGGRVTVASDGPGRGSEFTVRLPIDTDSVEPPPREEAQARRPRQAGRRILVVDDNVDTTEMLSLLLAIHGHEARVAHSGHAALRVADETRPDVVLLDLGLPDLDGCDVARQLRARPFGQHLLLVAVTGWGGDEDRLRTRQAGFDAHLLKPVLWEQLEPLLSDARLVD
jgi:PAS domain S-box-containing protein